jgi:glutamine synthetase
MNERLMAVCIGDIAGQVRAQSIPVATRKSRLLSGVGWTSANVQITRFDVIADSPYGPFGDVLMVPEPPPCPLLQREDEDRRDARGRIVAATSGKGVR